MHVVSGCSVWLWLIPRFDSIYVHFVLQSEKFKHQLPMIDRPPAGYCWQSLMSTSSSVRIRVVWDGGAEYPTLSCAAASRLLRSKQDLPDEQCALINLSRATLRRILGRRLQEVSVVEW